MGTIVTASNGQQLDLDNVPISLTYSGLFVGTLSTVLNGVTYTQTYTNNGTNITHISGWIAS